MAIATLQNRDAVHQLRAPLDDRHGWGFGLLLTAVATLCLRPADLIPAMNDWPVYQFLIICCLVVSARAAFRQLEWRQLAGQPATACLIWLLASVALSHLSHGFLWAARMSLYDVGKLAALYLLVVGLINTPGRLTRFVRWLAIAITIAATMAMLDRLEIISIAALETIESRDLIVDGERVAIERIRGTGIFHDPNDFGLILVTGLVMCAALLFRPQTGWPRYLWLIPSALLLTTLAMTHSRGALVSLAAAWSAALVYSRGWRVGAISLLVLPILAIVFSSRMTDVNSVNSGTGQSRIQLWSDSLSVWRQHPMFGLGEGFLDDEIGMVTHNSFLHCFAELGVFGGTAFFACFLAAILGLWSLRNLRPPANQRLPATAAHHQVDEASELVHFRVYIFAALAAYGAGLLTLSRQFVVPTYLILGLATAMQTLHRPNPAQWRVGNKFVALAVLGSMASLAFFYIVVQLMVRW